MVLTYPLDVVRARMALQQEGKSTTRCSRTCDWPVGNFTIVYIFVNRGSCIPLADIPAHVPSFYLCFASALLPVLSTYWRNTCLHRQRALFCRLDVESSAWLTRARYFFAERDVVLVVLTVHYPFDVVCHPLPPVSCYMRVYLDCGCDTGISTCLMRW